MQETRLEVVSNTYCFDSSGTETAKQPRLTDACPVYNYFRGKVTAQPTTSVPLLFDQALSC